ncbi:MAG: cation:proton antiporter, partial [Vicinamibacterales bacterium]
MNLDAPELTFAIALAAGMAAQIAARHLRLPGIVLLLLTGFLLGPDGTNLIRPETLGDGLHAVVGSAVAVILFEGGLHLELSRLRAEAITIRRLITMGAAVTAVGGTLASRWIMGWPWTVAVPFGTLVVVTGPTVTTPLLRRLRVERDVHTILEAEAVLIDPIGAIVSVMALELVLSQEIGAAARGLLGIPTRLVFGGMMGAVAGWVLARVLGTRRLIPQGLESVSTLALLLGVYASCEVVLPQSGIMAAPIAGMIVGNRHGQPGHELREFKEQLTVMLVGLLFVLLTADVRTAELAALGVRGAATVFVLMAIVRPIAVWISTRESGMDLRRRAFLAWLGPRGIVAAAVASLFARDLVAQGVSEGLQLRALVFLVIAATVLIEGLGGEPVARLLGVRRRSDSGWVIAGANSLARVLGRALRSHGEEVVLVDTDRDAIAAARADGLDGVVGNALDDEVLEQADVGGRRGALVVIPNEAVGLLVAEKVRREHRVGRADVAVRSGRHDVTPARLARAGASLLFGAETDLAAWIRRIDDGRAVLRRFRYL